VTVQKRKSAGKPRKKLNFSSISDLKKLKFLTVFGGGVSVSSRHVSSFWGDNQKKKREKSSCKVNFLTSKRRRFGLQKKVRESFSPLRKTTRGERIYLSPHTYIRKRKESLDKNTRWLRIASAPSPPWPTVSIASSTDSSFFLFSFGFRRRNCIQVFGGFGGTIT